MQETIPGGAADPEPNCEPATIEQARAEAAAALARDGIPAAAIGVVMELVARLATEGDA